MMPGRPLLTAVAAFALLLAGLLAWGFTRQAWDRAHPVILAGAAACPKLTKVSIAPDRFCQASMEVAGGVLHVSGHAPCACDGPGFPLRIGSRNVVFGSRDWAACVVRGPAMVMRVTKADIEGEFQAPAGWTAFTRNSGAAAGCWMVPDAQIDTENPRRLLDRAEWPRP